MNVKNGSSRSAVATTVMPRASQTPRRVWTRSWRSHAAVLTRRSPATAMTNTLASDKYPALNACSVRHVDPLPRAIARAAHRAYLSAMWAAATFQAS